MQAWYDVKITSLSGYSTRIQHILTAPVRAPFLISQLLVPVLLVLEILAGRSGDNTIR
jgi:hypothetical protein